MASHHHDDHQHHHEEDEDDEGLQCNHEEGHGKLDGIDIHSDPLFQKKEWDLQDWIDFTEKMPASKAKGKPSPKLKQYIGEIMPSEPGRILVPLCGRTPDLRWLYDRGNTVVGIEGVEKSVREFFLAHHDLHHVVEDCSFGKIYKTTDDRLKIYVCDVMKIPPDAIGQFDAVFDWGAYSGIHSDDREGYIKVIRGTLKDDYRCFVEICHDASEDINHGPASVPLRDLKVHFGTATHLRFLETIDSAEGWGVAAFFTSYVLVAPKKK